VAASDVAADETVVHRARFHPMVFSGAVTFALSVIGIVALIVHRNDLPPATVRQLWLVGVALALLGFVTPYLRWRAAEFVVTSRRLVIRTGWRAAHAFDVPLARLEGLDVASPFVGRRLGYGTVRIASPRGVETFQRVADPEALRDAVRKQTPRSAAARAR
jgi:membrane protein YdbS with pleckstrin-like domain